MARATQTQADDVSEDRFDPRLTYNLVGHERAETAFLKDFQSGKLHHAWLIAGPEGVGKATLAFRIARFLLQDDPDPQKGTLAVVPDATVSKLIANGSHSNLLVLSRLWDAEKKRLKTALTVDEVRKMHDFFHLAAGRSGWRVCIIDTADDLNISAANALLKNLEEPPPNTLILLLASTPGRLLPTIRSRCRLIRLDPLDTPQLIQVLQDSGFDDHGQQELTAIADLSDGSVGRAIQLLEHDGLKLYGDILALLNTLPNLDEFALEGFCAKVLKAPGDETFRLMFSLLTGWLEDLLTKPDKVGVLKDEQMLRHRLLENTSLEAWIDAWEQIRELERTCLGLHMDRKQTIRLAFQKLKQVCAAA